MQVLQDCPQRVCPPGLALRGVFQIAPATINKLVRDQGAGIGDHLPIFKGLWSNAFAHGDVDAQAFEFNAVGFAFGFFVGEGRRAVLLASEPVFELFNAG